MKLLAPKYYSEFSCIADKCKHTCCAGWEIDIDENSIIKYSAISSPYGKVINSSISRTDPPHFILADCDRCPHLDQQGFCKIIQEVGEEYLCDICREHPRFYNFTNHGKEMGIGISCEEACRIILRSDDFDQFITVSEDSNYIDVIEFDAVLHRSAIYKVLKDSSQSFDEKIYVICNEYNISLEDIDYSKLIISLDYLDNNHKMLLESEAFSFSEKHSDKLIRLLAYFIYRHTSEALDMEDFRASLGLSLVLTILVSSAFTKCDIEEISRIISEEIEYSEENTELIKSLFL